MMMYDDLIKQLRYCADATTCRNCIWKTECCPTDMQKKAADVIEELSKRVPPVPHGRLIDADALKEFFPDKGEGSWTYNIVVSGIIRDAPTIIPAEDGE